ncbi:MAG: hypothetical protein Q4D62_13945 [Planctomycetia bacterium]|nr:hypothetical protein [Planctomycetia bacterium]
MCDSGSNGGFFSSESSKTEPASCGSMAAGCGCVVVLIPVLGWLVCWFLGL